MCGKPRNLTRVQNMTATERLSFAYLAYTNNPTFGVALIGVYKSNRAAKSWFDLVNGEMVPIGKSNRVMQKINHGTGQIWWVEKHVMRDVR